MEQIRLKRGLDIPLKGEAETKVGKTIVPETVAVKPADFRGVVPKMLVKAGDRVKAGTIVFKDKLRPEIGFSSPCSGTVESIVRGERRRILEVRIKADPVTEYLSFPIPNMRDAKRNDIIKILLDSGLWAALIQRPFGIIANPADTPKGIFISGFDSAPLAADVNFTMRDEQDSLQEGVNVLSKLTGGSIYVSLSAKDYAASPLYKLKNVKQYCFSGAHPAGNVGIQINHISPIAKGETAWTITPAGVAAIGKLFTKGIYDISRLFAIAGPRSEHPCYVKAVPGFCLKQISEYISETDCKIYGQPVGIRCISGNVLTGSNIGAEGYTGFYDNEVSFVSEGNYNELFGWAKIFRPKKFSMSHSYFSWLCPKRKYNADTNVNGGERAFVMSGLYEKVVPMDIYPVYLIKAILAEDIDKMEQLGIYEVLEEDFALCEYICPSKINVQDIISRGISLMMKEMA